MQTAFCFAKYGSYPYLESPDTGVRFFGERKTQFRKD